MPYHRSSSLLASLALIAPLGAPTVAEADDVINESGQKIDYVVTVQPIEVCYSDGSDCNSSVAAFPRFAKEVFAQAGIALVMLPARQLLDPTFLSVDDLKVFDAPGLGQSSNRRTLNVWFANEVLSEIDGELKPIAGKAFVNGNGAAINSPGVIHELRQSSFAHELGHNLGLDHGFLGATTAMNLMTDGKVRNPLADELTQAQIDVARSSIFAVEAPKVEVTWGAVNVEGIESTEVSVRFSADLQDFALRRLSFNLPATFQGPPSQRPATRDSGLALVESSVEDLSWLYEEEFQRTWPSGGDSTPEGEEPVDPTPVDVLPELVFDFGANGMRVGDTLTFRLGLIESLRNEYTGYFARAMGGALIDFEFDFGLAVRSLAADEFGSLDSQQVYSFLDTTLDPTPFGPQFGPGEFPRIGDDIESEPLGGAPVPLAPGSVFMLASLALGLTRLRAAGPTRVKVSDRSRH